VDSIPLHHDPFLSLSGRHPDPATVFFFLFLKPVSLIPSVPLVFTPQISQRYQAFFTHREPCIVPLPFIEPYIMTPVRVRLRSLPHLIVERGSVSSLNFDSCPPKQSLRPSPLFLTIHLAPHPFFNSQSCFSTDRINKCLRKSPQIATTSFSPPPSKFRPQRAVFWVLAFGLGINYPFLGRRPD